MIQSNWRCPVCQHPLYLNGNTWQCDNRHTFDMAKDGYVNLLLAQNKNSKSPGDSKDMVAARRLFLDAGHYQPLVARLAELVSEFDTDQTSPITLLDAGCGEGYYLSEILNALANRDSGIQSYGIDIAKPAVQKAAKRLKQQQFAVASTYDIPLQNDSCDAALQVFAPAADGEIHRVLKPGGIRIVVSPAANHLFELKQMVYDNPQRHQPSTQIPDGFSLAHSETKSFTLQLDSAPMRNALLLMTPFYWQISAQKKAVLIESLTDITADFAIQVFRKKF